MHFFSTLAFRIFFVKNFFNIFFASYYNNYASVGYNNYTEKSDIR